MSGGAHPWVLFSAGLYVAAMLAIGFWALARTRSSTDFFLAGRRLGLWTTAIATMASAFSGFVFLGGPGLTYARGTSSFWIVLPIGVTPALLCWVLGRQLHRLASGSGAMTIPDAIRLRYRSDLTAGLAATTIVLGSLAYLAAQFLAMGIVIQTVFGVEHRLSAVLIGMAIVMTYSVCGGMVAAVYTDLLQGALMMFTAVAVTALAVSSAGGWSAMTDSLGRSELFPSGFLDPHSAGLAVACGTFFVFSVGVLGQPHVIHKFYMLGDADRLRYMPLVLGGAQAVVLMIWVGVGLAVPALVAQGRMPPLSDPDRAMPELLVRFAPPWLAGMAFAAVLGAVMSTVDSFLNVCAAALTRDLPRAFGFRPSDRLAGARSVSVVLALAAAAFAVLYGDLIALLGTFAFGTFAAGLAPALAVGLNWERVPASAANASIVVGVGLTLLLEWLRRDPSGTEPVGLFSRLPPAALSLAAAFVVLLGVTLVASRGGSTETAPAARVAPRS